MEKKSLRELKQHFGLLNLPLPIGTGKDGRILKVDYLNTLSEQPTTKHRGYQESSIFEVALRLPVTKIERLMLLNSGFRRLLTNNLFWKKKLEREGIVLWHENIKNYYLYYLQLRPRGGFLKFISMYEFHKPEDIGQQSLVDCIMIDKQRFLLTELGEVHYRNKPILKEVKAISFVHDRLVYLKFNGELGWYRDGLIFAIIQQGIQELSGSWILDRSGQVHRLEYENRIGVIEIIKGPELKIAHLRETGWDCLATSVDGKLYLIDLRDGPKLIGSRRFISATFRKGIYSAVDIDGQLLSKHENSGHPKWKKWVSPQPIIWVSGKYLSTIGDIGNFQRTNDAVAKGLNRIEVRRDFRDDEDKWLFFDTRPHRAAKFDPAKL